LRTAGAVILGKTVTTAYAYLDPPVTRNPWDATRTPGGSSSGSAAAVACGMCLGALGSQTVGSLTRPASYCGVCSLKPAVADAGSDGVLPLAPTLDHVGVIARCVRDLADVAGVVLDVMPADAPWFVTLGGGFEARADPAMRAALARVRDITRPVERSLPASAADLPRHLRAILATEAAAYHGDRLRRHPDDYPPKIRELVEEGLRVRAADYQAALAHRDGLRVAMEAVCGGGEVLLTPATPGPAPDRSTTGDAVFNAPWSYTGLPTVSLPVGRSDDGLPLAVQLVGGAGQVPRLFTAAAWLERQLGFDVGLLPGPG
jgi:aspartyl-tRNA(Asn)/glutamyl-tRNA(Gln) amidotransferase subunit A